MKNKLFLSGLIITAMSIGCNNSSDNTTGGDSTSVKPDSNTGGRMQADSGSSATIQKNPSTVSKADSAFVKTAADAGMTEITLGNIATKNAASEKVKAFGEMMVKDHTAAGDELKKIAGVKNIAIPDSLSAGSRQHVASLEKLKGKAFDKAYIDMMIEGHGKVLKAFEDIQLNGADTELKAFAGKTVPVIKSHLDAAKSIKETLK